MKLFNKRTAGLLLSVATLLILGGCKGNGESDIAFDGNIISDVPPVVVTPTPEPTAQELALAKIIAYAENGLVVPVLQDYMDVGVVGVTTDDLAEINQVVENLTEEEVDTKEEIQAIFDSLGIRLVLILTRQDTIAPDGVCLQHIEHSGPDNNFNGVLDDAEVTSTSAAIYTNGIPITETELDNMIANDENVTGVNTCKITRMDWLFAGNSEFNQDIGNWNTGAVTTMNTMFAHATKFNQDISRWNTGAVTDMTYMFKGASNFNKNLSGWTVSNVIAYFEFAAGAGFGSNTDLHPDFPPNL